MKILVVNNHFSNTGGADLYSYNLGNLLKKHGNDVFYFATDAKPYFEPDYEHRHFFPKLVDYLALSKLDLIKEGFKPFYNLDAQKKMDMMLEEVRPDIVHINCIFYKLSPSILLPCYKRNIPVVITLHGPQFMCPAIKMMYKSEVYCQDELCVSGNPIHCVINKCCNKSFIKSFGMTTEYLFRKAHGLYNGIAHYISPSQALAKLAIKSGIDKEKITCLNNFVLDDLFKITPNYNNNGYFLFASRLSKEKGIADLLEAMSKLPEEIKLRIVGSGPDEEYFKKLAVNINLKNVEFLGFKSGDELKEQYKNCIGTILPCNWFENFPTTIIESFAYGKPVIATRIGGIPEMVDDYATGITFELKNTTELADAISLLYKNEELTQQMGKNARQKAELKYSESIYYKSLMKIYLHLCHSDKYTKSYTKPKN